MTLAERLSSTVTLDLNGREWRLLITHAVLVSFEQLTGVNIMAGELDLLRMSARLTRALLFCALARAGAPYSLQEAGDLIAGPNFVQIRVALLRAWDASMPDLEDDDSDESAERPESFTWVDAWAIARQDLKLLNDEWLDLTPRLCHALRKRQIAHWQREEILFGNVAATAANFSAAPPSEPLTAEAFMMHPIKQKQLSPEEAGDQLLLFLRSRHPAAAVEITERIQ
jgi:hypothetical protein